jgi:hypothetical protein
VSKIHLTDFAADVRLEFWNVTRDETELVEHENFFVRAYLLPWRYKYV